MTENYYYGDLTRKQQRDVDRDRSRENAQNTSGVTSDRQYMKQLGKEGIKRQQEHMLSKGSDVAADYDAAAYIKSRGRKTRNNARERVRAKKGAKKRAASKR